MDKSISLKNDLSEISRLTEFVTGLGTENGLPEKTVYDFNLAIEEIVTNIISYGYDDKNEHSIVVSADIKEDGITLTVEDDGTPFNPLETPAPDVNKPLEERQIGGLGIFFVRKLMDEVKYERHDNKNVLALKKLQPKKS